MTWQSLDRTSRIELIQKHWFERCSATTLAGKIASTQGYAVSRNSLLGLYTRNPVLKKTHPLNGDTHPHADKTRRKIPKGSNKVAVLSKTVTMEAAPPKHPAHQVRIPPGGVEYDAASMHLTLEQLTQQQCHWPVNNPKKGETHLFCGMPCGSGARYCPHHLDRNTIKRNPNAIL